MKRKNDSALGEEAAKRALNQLSPDQYFPPGKPPLYSTASVLSGLSGPPPLAHSQIGDANSALLQSGLSNPLQYYQPNNPCRFNPYFSAGPTPTLVPLSVHNSLTSLENIGVTHQTSNSTNQATNSHSQSNHHLSLLPSHHNNPIPAHHNNSPLPAHINTSHPAHHSHPSALPAHLSSSSLLQAHQSNIPTAHLNNTPAHLNNTISSRNSSLGSHSSLSSHFNSPPAHLNSSSHSSNSSNNANNFSNSAYSLHNNSSHLNSSLGQHIGSSNSVNNSSLHSPHTTSQQSPRSTDLPSPHSLLNLQTTSAKIVTTSSSTSVTEQPSTSNSAITETQPQPSQPEVKPPPPKPKISILERAKANRPPRKELDPESFKKRQEKLSAKLNSLVRHKILDLVNSRCKYRETVDSSEAAKALSPRAWKDLMPLVKKVGTELIKEGLIVATRNGVIVDLASITGPVRFGLPEELTDEEEYLIRTYTKKIKNQKLLEKGAKKEKKGKGRGKGKSKAKGKGKGRGRAKSKETTYTPSTGTGRPRGRPRKARPESFLPDDHDDDAFDSPNPYDEEYSPAEDAAEVPEVTVELPCGVDANDGDYEDNGDTHLEEEDENSPEETAQNSEGEFEEQEQSEDTKEDPSQKREHNLKALIALCEKSSTDPSNNSCDNSNGDTNQEHGNNLKKDVKEERPESDENSRTGLPIKSKNKSQNQHKVKGATIDQLAKTLSKLEQNIYSLTNSNKDNSTPINKDKDSEEVLHKPLVLEPDQELLDGHNEPGFIGARFEGDH